MFREPSRRFLDPTTREEKGALADDLNISDALSVMHPWIRGPHPDPHESLAVWVSSFPRRRTRVVSCETCWKLRVNATSDSDDRQSRMIAKSGSLGTGQRFRYQLYTFNLKYNTRSRKHRHLSNSADKGTKHALSNLACPQGSVHPRLGPVCVSDQGASEGFRMIPTRTGKGDYPQVPLQLRLKSFGIGTSIWKFLETGMAMPYDQRFGFPVLSLLSDFVF